MTISFRRRRVQHGKELLIEDVRGGVVGSWAFEGATESGDKDEEDKVIKVPLRHSSALGSANQDALITSPNPSSSAATSKFTTAGDAEADSTPTPAPRISNPNKCALFDLWNDPVASKLNSRLMSLASADELEAGSLEAMVQAATKR
jgi:hypothetical protein